MTRKYEFTGEFGIKLRRMAVGLRMMKPGECP